MVGGIRPKHEVLDHCKNAVLYKVTPGTLMYQAGYRYFVFDTRTRKVKEYERGTYAREFFHKKCMEKEK